MKKMSLNNMNIVNDAHHDNQHLTYGYHAIMSLGHASYDHTHQQPMQYNIHRISSHLQLDSLEQTQSSNIHETNNSNNLFLNANNDQSKELRIDSICSEIFKRKRENPNKYNKFSVTKNKKNNTNSEISYTLNLKSPICFMDMYLDDHVINLLVDGTNWYINHVPKRRKDKVSPVTSDEIKCVIAVLYLSGYVNLPRMRMFWERAPDTSFPLVVNAIPRDRFETIFTNLHSAGSSYNDTKDPLSKIGTLVDRLRQKFLELAPPDDMHSVDELRVPYYKKATGLRQFTKNKIMKVWCGCTSSGYCSWFDHIEETQSLCNNPNAAANRILAYASKIPTAAEDNPTLIFDNIFSNPRINEELNKLKVDAKPVHNRVPLAASKGNVTPDTIKEKSKVYNSLMGGTDKLDQNIYLYAITVIGKKWTSHLLLAYVLDLTMQNAWQIYRLQNPNSLDLLGFRRSVVTHYLTKFGKPANHDSSAVNNNPQNLNKPREQEDLTPGKSLNHKCRDSRYDGLEHYVIPQQKQTRCFYCKMKTMTRCRKCDVGLHVKCFVKYHTRGEQSFDMTYNDVLNECE